MKKFVALGIGAVVIVCLIVIGKSFFTVNQSNKTAELITEWLNETPDSITMYDGYRMIIEAKPEQIHTIIKSLKDVRIQKEIEYKMIVGGSFFFDFKYPDKKFSYGFTSGEGETWVTFSINDQEFPTCYSVPGGDYAKMEQLIQQLVTDAQT